MKRSIVILSALILAACGDGSSDEASRVEIAGLWRSSCNLEQVSYVRRDIEFKSEEVVLLVEAFEGADCQTSGFSSTTYGVYTVGDYVTSSEGLNVKSVEISWFDQDGDVRNIDRFAVHIENDVLYFGQFDESTGIPSLDFDIQWVKQN